MSFVGVRYPGRRQLLPPCSIRPKKVLTIAPKKNRRQRLNILAPPIIMDGCEAAVAAAWAGTAPKKGRSISLSVLCLLNTSHEVFFVSIDIQAGKGEKTRFPIPPKKGR